MRKLKPDFLYGIAWFFAFQAILLCLIGLSYLNTILASTTLFTNSIADFSSTGGKAFVLIFAVVNYVCYLAFLSWLPIPLVLIIGKLFSEKTAHVTAVLLSSIILSLLVVDVQVYAVFKFHLNQAIWQLILAGNWQETFDLSRYEILLLAGYAIIITIFELLLLFFIIRFVKHNKLKAGFKTIYWSGAGGLGCCYAALLLSMAGTNNLLSQQTPSLPWYDKFFTAIIPIANATDGFKRYSEHHFSQPAFNAEKLCYPKKKLYYNSDVKKNYNIIFIMIDSLRFDSLNADTMPALTNFAAQNISFSNYLSGGNATQPGLFSLFYSLPPSYWYSTLKYQTAPVFMDELKKLDYDFKIIWSSEMHNPPFNKTIFANIASLPLNGMAGQTIADSDRALTKKALHYLQNTNPNKRFFMHLFYDAPHGYCRTQNFPQPFKPIIERCQRLGMNNSIDPQPYFNRYKNAVRFVDGELEYIFRSLKQKGLFDNSIVIITSDHGQEFNDLKHNYWGHASNFTNTQIHVPLVIHWPGKKSQNIAYQTSSYDVIPTILTRAFGCKNPMSDYSIGQDLFSPNLKTNNLILGSYVNTAIRTKDKILTLQTSGAISITDLNDEQLESKMLSKNVLMKAFHQMREFYCR